MHPNGLRDLRARAARPFWESDLASRTIHVEIQLAADFIARLHGDSVVWLGQSPLPTVSLKKRLIKCPVYVSPGTPRPVDMGEDHEPGVAPDTIENIVADFDCLPFQSRSVDAVVLHHALEQVPDPRTVLREATRILAPGGRLLLFGYNPWSLLGVRRGLAAFLPDRMSQLRLINPIRLFDWFALLGLELDAPPAYGAFGLLSDPASSRVPIPQPSQMPFGGLIVTSAVKQQATMQFRWQGAKPRPKLAAVAYPRVATWKRTQPADD